MADEGRAGFDYSARWESTVAELVLTLPIPPSPNRVSTRNHMARHHSKRKYQKRAWSVAVNQVKPFRDPPEHVTVHAHFRVHNLRDYDNLDASLKWALDALRQKQTGKDWRRGLYSQCGYMIDDDPAHMTKGQVTQEIDRKNKGLTLTITYGG